MMDNIGLLDLYVKSGLIDSETPINKVAKLLGTKPHTAKLVINKWLLTQ